jgi:hypothetical protein
MGAELTVGVKINMQKTQHTEVTKQPTNTESVKIVGQEYERVN